MDITWLDPEHLERRDVDGAVAILEAARVVDHPHQQVGTSASQLTIRLTRGWDGEPPVAAVTREARGRVIGLLELYLSHWDNTHLGFIQVTVDPLARRQGVGRRLFEAGVERIRADGRTVVLAECFDDTAGVGFLKAMGLDRASEAIKRRQHVLTLDWARLDQDYATAERHATGYELIKMPGATPDDMIADVVRMTEAINDAPTDDLDVQDEVFSPERIRSFEATQEALGRRIYRLVARERATGMLAGHTMVSVESDRPVYAWQFDTSVLGAHRGHRLGLILKIGMLRWLAEEEPQLRTLDTWNAASNAHMINVNEILGYRVVASEIQWQRHL